MALNLNPQLRARLREILLEILPTARITSGCLLDRVGFLPAIHLIDKALPSSGKLFDLLDQTVGTSVGPDVFLDLISDEVDSFDFDADAPPQTLGDKVADLQPVADRILAQFESLPWAYTLTFALPQPVSSFLAGFVTSQSIGPGARLVKVDADVRRSLPLPPALGMAALSGSPVQPARWAEGDVVLQVDALGYIRWDFGTVTADAALTVLRSFIGLGLALKLFEYGAPFAQQENRVAYVHKVEGGGSELITKYRLSHSQSRAVAGVCIASSVLRLPEAEQITVAQHVLSEINRIFDNPKASRNIRLAGKWFCDGTFGDDDLLNYVQTTMVLEILLGDKATSDQVGLGTLLANRCAYLIGRSHSERQRIINEFAKIYDVRSHIVHRGKDNLGAAEIRSFAQLRWLAARVIREETKLMFADLGR